MSLNDDQLDLVLKMWREHADTQAIADVLGIPEYQVFNGQRYKPVSIPSCAS